jgi:hypothetical protein
MQHHAKGGGVARKEEQDRRVEVGGGRAAIMSHQKAKYDDAVPVQHSMFSFPFPVSTTVTAVTTLGTQWFCLAGALQHRQP